MSTMYFTSLEAVRNIFLFLLSSTFWLFQLYLSMLENSLKVIFRNIFEQLS